MENVYTLVKRFYLEHGRANIFVARTLIERYLRAAAWRGRSSEELRSDWYCIEDLLTVIQRRDDSLARLFIRIDYLALFFRYADAHIDRRPLKRHAEDYFARMRAFLTYLDETGDLYDMNAYEHATEEEKETFWLRFWDYFFFDYHLIAMDETPIAHYSEMEWDSLSYDEREIIHDLLAARFAVLAVTEEYDDHIVCRDILRDEEIVLPHPDIPGTLSKSILFGHICDEGITAIPASKRLQKRISDTLHREYDLYCMQAVEASMDDFLEREAALVRHTIHVLSTLAQINVLPRRILPKPTPRTLHPRDCEEELAILATVAEKLGFSCYGRALMAGLYLDYAQADSVRAQTAEALTATIFLFAEINNIDLSPITELYHVFGSTKRKVCAARDRMRETLGCISFDPRYLGEEGFVTMLYSVVHGKEIF